MVDKIQIQEAILTKTLPHTHCFIGAYCLKLTANEALVHDLTFKSEIMKAINVDFFTAITRGINHEPGQVRLSHEIDSQIRGYFKQNARDVQKKANELMDYSLPDMMGHSILGPRTPIYIPDIFLENGVLIGSFDYRIKADDMAYVYNMECTQLAEDDSVVLITERTLTNAIGSFDGFVSGAKYFFRSQPIYANNKKGKFTEIFYLRAN